MTLNKLVPWGRKQVPIRREESYNRPSLWTDFEDPAREIQRLFDRFLSLSPDLLNDSMHQDFSPVLDVHETEKEFQVNLEVPGMNEHDIDVSISNNMLTIRGEKKEEKEE